MSSIKVIDSIRISPKGVLAMDAMVNMLYYIDVKDIWMGLALFIPCLWRCCALVLSPRKTWIYSTSLTEEHPKEIFKPFS